MIIYRRQNFKGFALTEVLLAVAVIIIVGISGYALYARGRISTEVTKVTAEVNIIKAGVDSLYTIHDYTGISMNDLDRAGLLHNDITSNDGGVTYENPFGGQYSLSPGTASNHVYWITLTKVKDNACTQVVSNLAALFTRIGNGVGDASIKEVPNPNININALNTACNNNNNNVLSFSVANSN